MGEFKLFKITFGIDTDGGTQDYIYLVKETGDSVVKALNKAETAFRTTHKTIQYWNRINIELIEGELID